MEPADTLFKHFSFPSPLGTVEMTELLASGSYGTVWKATCNEQAYAVKILFKHGLDDAQLKIQALEYELHSKVFRHSLNL
jgi:hypothetical protein